tara:strand:+ start:344 stop:1027 length:684 start_codon:yes stop_codon:yes gene_type:complete
MDGIHDLGGKHGFGAVSPELNEPVFHEGWEARVFALVLQLGGNLDRSRHAIERIDPISYLADTYYGRWLGGLETRLVEDGVLSQSEITERARGLGADVNDRVAARPRDAGDQSPEKKSSTGGFSTAQRTLKTPPRFQLGDQVRTKSTSTEGHTRMPAYVRGCIGEVIGVHGGWVYPDSHAHGKGEGPECLYTVRFTTEMLWGEAGEKNIELSIDLFEAYLEQVNDDD